MTMTISSLDELSDLAKHIAPQLTTGMVIALVGELGAGKTTFTQLLAKQVGVADQLTSPTFSIMNQYQMKNGDIFYHLDLYRLRNLDEVLGIGLEEIIEEKKGVVIIEWPELAQPVLPQDTLWIKFQLNDDQTRTVTILNSRSEM